jgi:energy-converting hydrogenase Eha subunit A
MARIAHFAAVLSLAALAVAQTNPEDQAFVTPTAAPTSVISIGAQTVTITATATVTQAASAAPEITAVSDCHAHGTVK